ncbi:MAG: hypothetical protein DRI71_12215 [Bacteroidetes bacterium]|nr:MAG: hypothetical protein DRI71_12215 [Bacteroidota bacterium]
MNTSQRRQLSYLFIILYWVTTLVLLNFILINSVKVYLNISGLDPNFENALTIKWLAPQQYIDGTLFGLFFGAFFILVTKLSRRLRIERFGFGKSILINSGIFLAGFTLAAFLMDFTMKIYESYIGEKRIPVEMDDSMMPLVLVILLIFVFQIILLNFILQSIEVMGDYNIIRFITGKYRTPVIENRAFMFLDLRSSVQHAEKLGNVLYSELIRDCFRELNYLVYKFEAEIYQYVGDEIVLTWESSVAQNNNNILGIFFAFDQALQKKSGHYLNKYGIVPEFKAGCNAGEVTAAEIGIIKRDIAYHGDVINTSSRVQGMCNVLHHDLLITPSLINDEIPLQGFEIKSVGQHNLKGKGNETELFSVLLKADNNDLS